MNSKKSLSRKKVAQALTIACLTVLTGVAVGNTWRSSFLHFASRAQSDVKPTKGQTLRKNRTLSKERAGLPFSIQLNGLQQSDYVNIRPTEKSQVDVTAGSVIATDMAKAHPGEQLPDSAVDISDNSLTFTRPSSAEGLLFVDLQVPRGLHVEVAFDSITILSALLREPVSFRGKQIGAGSANAAEAIAQTLLPQGLTRDQGASRPLADGKLFVPFSELRLVKKIAIEKAKLVGAILEIDSTGQVISVRSLTGTIDHDIEGKLRKWEFTPYQQDGRAVSVFTVLTPSNQ